MPRPSLPPSRTRDRLSILRANRAPCGAALERRTMKFHDQGALKFIEFEPEDTDVEKRIVEQALALLLKILERFREVKA